MENQEYIITLIAKKLSANANAAEEAELDGWIALSEDNFKFYSSFQQSWNFEPKREAISFEANKTKAWDKVLSSIEEAETTAPASVRLSAKKIRIWSVVSMAAAILLIAFFIRFSMQTDAPAEMQHLLANDTPSLPHTLGDGSLVYLNKNAELIFPQQFDSKQRHVSLTGEGYFDVKHMPDKAFVVETSTLQITVLGTSFNVWHDHKNAMKSHVAVDTGKVKVQFKNSDKSVVLHAGEMLTADATTGTLTTEAITDRNFLAWKTGLLNFQDTPLESAFAAIGRTYGLDVNVRTDISGYRLTARFENESYEDIFKTLQILYPVTIAANEGKVEILSP